MSNFSRHGEPASSLLDRIGDPAAPTEAGSGYRPTSASNASDVEDGIGDFYPRWLLGSIATLLVVYLVLYQEDFSNWIVNLLP